MLVLIGVDFKIDPDLVVPDRSKSIKDGAIYPWSKSATGYYDDVINAVSSYYNIDLTIPFENLPEAHQQIILCEYENLAANDIKQLYRNLSVLFRF